MTYINKIRRARIYKTTYKIFLGCDNIDDYEKISKFYYTCDYFEKKILEEEFKLKELYSIEKLIFSDSSFKYIKEYLNTSNYSKVAEKYKVSKQNVHHNVNQKFKKIQMICNKTHPNIDIKEYLIEKYKIMNSYDSSSTLNKTQLVKEILIESKSLEKKELLQMIKKFIDIDNKTLTSILARLKKDGIISIINRVVITNNAI